MDGVDDSGSRAMALSNDQGYGRKVIFFGGGCNGSGSLARVIPLFLCGLKLTCCFNFDMNPQWNGQLRCQKNRPSKVLL